MSQEKKFTNQEIADLIQKLVKGTYLSSDRVRLTACFEGTDVLLWRAEVLFRGEPEFSFLGYANPIEALKGLRATLPLHMFRASEIHQK